MKFDFIVVGAGSAGCIVASRLAAAGDASVLLIEAGSSGRDPLLRVPLMTGRLLRGRRHNWFYQTEPEEHLEGRRIFWPRGKVLGGSSAINGMVYTRGTKTDYDSWAQRGLPDWCFDKVLPAFKRSENYLGGADEWHGRTGPMPIERGAARNPLFDAFIAAGVQAGYPLTADFNGEQQEGFGRYDFTIEKGERWSTARAFLSSARRPSNLTIMTGARLMRVRIADAAATGVTVMVKGRVQEIEAEGEVVLCCGTVNSPAALLHSGVGDGDLLRSHGIDTLHDLKGVGKNLQDHLLIRVEHTCLEPITLHSILRADKAALAVAQAMLTRTGPASSFPLQAGAFLKSDPTLSEPDLQSHFLPGLSTAALRFPFSGKAGRYDGHGFFANIYQLRPDSRGEVSIRSSDTLEPPLIRPRYLSSPNDLRVLRQGVRILRHVFSQPAFDPYRGRELSPGPQIATDGEINRWIAATADTVFHPVGSCRMGNDDGAVVDGRLRVRGIARLRIADASIMPMMPSSNTHAPSMMIGEQAAAFIIDEHRLGRRREAA